MLHADAFHEHILYFTGKPLFLNLTDLERCAFFPLLELDFFSDDKMVVDDTLRPFLITCRRL